MATNFYKDPLGSAERNLSDVRSRIRQTESNLSELKAGGPWESDAALKAKVLQKEAEIADMRGKESLYQGTYNFAKSGDYRAGTHALREYERLGAAGQAKYLTPVELRSDNQMLSALGKPMESTANLSSPAALRAQEQERAAYAAAGAQAKAPTIPPPTPTPVDNVIDAEAFVSEPGGATVGATNPLAAGAKSPIFVQGSDLYYIPAGGTAPVKISGPAELQNLAAAGAIEVNGQRQALSNASAFLNSQQAPASRAQAPGFLESVGGGTGAVSSMLGSAMGQVKPFDQAILDSQKAILGFQPADLTNFRQQLEKRSGVDDILDQLATVDDRLAELIGIERRVPETTLAAAQNTEITQSILDRQRSIELEKLAKTTAPITDLKRVLEDDLKRRTSLIDESVQLKKDAENFKMEQLGRALDFAVANRSIAKNMADSIFEAAVSDYRISLDEAAAKAKAASEQVKSYNDAVSDYYKAFGMVLNPMTGKFEKAPVKSGSSSKKVDTAELDSWIHAVLNGSSAAGVPAEYRDLVVNALPIIGNTYGPLVDYTQEDQVRAREIIEALKSKQTSTQDSFDSFMNEVLSSSTPTE